MGYISRWFAGTLEAKPTTNSAAGATAKLARLLIHGQLLD
jgi:hypothetical protein